MRRSLAIAAVAALWVACWVADRARRPVALTIRRAVAAAVLAIATMAAAAVLGLFLLTRVAGR